MRALPPAPVPEPGELISESGSNETLRCNTTTPDVEVRWEKLNSSLDGRMNCSDLLLTTSGFGLSGSGEQGDYVPVSNGSLLEFGPVVFGDEGCYRCVAAGMPSDLVTVTGINHSYTLHCCTFYISFFDLQCLLRIALLCHH